VYKKNELKNLIYIQENKPCNEQTIKSLFRSIVEPILDDKIESIILYRLGNRSKENFGSLLKRLEYSNAKIYDFSSEPINQNVKNAQNVLSENIWDKTEFVYVLAERFGAVLIFDYEISEIDGFAEFYLLHNSKNLSESFDIIKSNAEPNAKAELTDYQEKHTPDRRDNVTLNNSIRKIVEILNEANQEALQEVLISEFENAHIQEDNILTSRLEFISNKSRYVSHELRNQLSICDLYSTIIQKQLNKLEINDETVETSLANAVNCIQKALKMAGNSLVDLKSLSNNDLQAYDLKTLTDMSVELSQVYINGKNIRINNNVKETTTILVDENKFLGVLINLIKNGIESITEEQRAGLININAEIEAENVSILISNNGKPIEKEVQAKIYEDGFTTKAMGSGLGLSICRKSLEEQSAQLKLKKSDKESTEFEIIFEKVTK